MKKMDEILLPASIATLGFWNQLFFWITVIASIKLWLEHRKHINKDKVRVTINGREYYAKDITITDGYIFIDGKYVCPTDITSVSVHRSQ